MSWLPEGFARRTLGLAAGRALHYIEGGTGRPVVYLHGAGGPRISPALREACHGRRLLVPIYPGFEGTPEFNDVPDVRGLAGLLAVFVATCAGRPCELIAQSLGGHVALWLAALHPSCVRSMLLECPSGFRKGERPQGDPQQLLYAHPEKIPQEPQYSSEHASSNQLAAARYRASSFDQDLWERAPDIDCRVLLVHGKQDRLLDAEISRRLGETLPRARLVLVEDAAHGIEIDQPAEFARIAREHLGAHSPANPSPLS